MPNSVRCIIKKCLHKGAINQQEFDKIMRKLDEPIRCKDCMYYGVSEQACGHWWGLYKAYDDGYCSYAERREE